MPAMDEAKCKTDDVLLERWTFVRFAVLGLVVFSRVFKMWRRGGGETASQETPFKENPRLTKQMTGMGVFGLPIAGVLFIQSEGVGLFLYFAVSALMDNYTIYFITNVDYCEYVMQVALYSMALLTFLPTVVISYMLQRSWYERGTWGYEQDNGKKSGMKSVFVGLMVAATAVSFLIRLSLVYHWGWDDTVYALLSDKTYKVYVAILVPPIVDMCQSVLLLFAGMSAESQTAPDEESPETGALE